MTPTLKALYDRCEEEGGCMLWKHACGAASGSPIISLSSKQRGQLVRRIVWELTHGEPVGRGMYVYTLNCDSRCISHQCLLRGTKSDYMRAAAKRGSYSTPELRVVRAKAARARSAFTPDVIAQIRADRENKETLTVLAERYGMSLDNVHKIVTRRTWADSMPSSSVFNWRPA